MVRIHFDFHSRIKFYIAEFHKRIFGVCLFSITERLRRLDESIRSTLAEKQKIVCDIFRIPNEHFSAIADIAGLPEAPKV